MDRRSGPLDAADTIDTVPAATLYPDTPPFRMHDLAVDGGHVLRVQEHGRPEGLPSLVLHGGPGSGCSPLLHRYFDPARFRVICVDQRGAGLSRPRGSIVHNTTAHLLDDLCVLREHLRIARWLVVGGSWGATLAAAHAAAQPHCVAALLLRASFLARAEDIDWFFQGAAIEQPQAWDRFAAVAPAAQRDALAPFFAREFAEGEPSSCRALAQAWWQWERSLATGVEGGAPPFGAALDALVDRYRVQSHYLQHRCWLDAPTLLERCEKLPRVPTLLLHARDDRVCRPEGALSLHRRLAHGELRWVDGAGHDPAHPAMVAAMVDALDCYAARGNFEIQR